MRYNNKINNNNNKFKILKKKTKFYSSRNKIFKK